MLQFCERYDFFAVMVSSWDRDPKKKAEKEDTSLNRFDQI